MKEDQINRIRKCALQTKIWKIITLTFFWPPLITRTETEVLFLANQHLINFRDAFIWRR